MLFWMPFVMSGGQGEWPEVARRFGQQFVNARSRFRLELSPRTTIPRDVLILFTFLAHTFLQLDIGFWANYATRGLRLINN